MEKKWFKELPIARYAESIASQLNTVGRCVLTSPTGTGKTIYLPLHLLTAVEGISKVYVSQPRISQAESNSATAIEGCGQPDMIGHITGRGTSSNANASVVYMTEGILTSKLGKEDMSSTLVVIDEAHELELNTIINLYKARELGCKVLIMSATVQGTMFASYLNCNVVEATTTSFSVEGSPVFGSVITSQNLTSTVNTRLEEGYNFIVICPGKKEIAEVQAIVEAYATKASSKVTVYLMHGEMDSKDRMAYLQHKEGQAVIIATNIGRTGLTYPKWIKSVIDLGQIRHMVNVKGVKQLTTYSVSKAEVAQAAGRIGRMQLEQGSMPYKYTLIGSYDSRQQYPLRAIDLLDAREFVVNTLSQGVDNENLITPYNQMEYNEVLEELRANDVIESNNSFTVKGKRIAPLLTMLEYNQALILYYAMELGIAKEVAKFLAIEAYTKFGTVIDKKADEDKTNKFFSKFVSTSYANIKLYDSIVAKKNNKEVRQAKESMTFYMAEQEALEGYRKLSIILSQLGYMTDTQQVTEQLCSVVVVAAKGCKAYRVAFDTKVSAASEGSYFSYTTGTVTSIGRATFLTNVTYFNEAVVALVYKLDPSLFTKERVFNADSETVTVYAMGNAEMRISTPLTTEEIHAKAVSSIYLPNYQSQIKVVNTKLELLGEDKVVLVIKTVPTFASVESQKELIIESLEKSIEDIKKHYSFVNEILPDSYKGSSVSYSAERILLAVSSLSNFLTLPLELGGVVVFYCYKGQGVLSHTELSQLYYDYVANEKKQEEIEKERLVINSYKACVKVDFKLSVEELIDSFTVEYNSLLSADVYKYIAQEKDAFYWRKTDQRDIAESEKESLKTMALDFYYCQEFEHSIGEINAYLDEIDYRSLTAKQSLLCEALEDVLKEFDSSLSMYVFHVQAVRLLNQLIEDRKDETESESDLAVMLRQAMLG